MDLILLQAGGSILGAKTELPIFLIQFPLSNILSRYDNPRFENMSGDYYIEDYAP